MTNDNQLISEMGKLIEMRRWGIFLTVTFRRNVSSREAKRRFKYFFKHLNTKKARFFEKFVLTLAFFENNIDRNGVHIHSFVDGIDPSCLVELEKRCRDFFGDSKALIYDPAKGAKFYMGKKYAYSQLDDFDLLRINSKLRSVAGCGLV